jgi:uncharacterized membrane protein
MRIEESIVINRSPEDVFAFLAVRNNDPVWMGVVVESEWLDSAAPLALGRRGRMSMRMFGRRAEYVDEVTAYDPGRRIAHRTVEGPFDLDTACRCEPANGGCRTTVVAEAEKMVGRLLDPLVARLMRRGFRADLAKLKQILEGDARGRPLTAQGRGRPETTARP